MRTLGAVERRGPGMEPPCARTERHEDDDPGDARSTERGPPNRLGRDGEGGGSGHGFVRSTSSRARPASAARRSVSKTVRAASAVSAAAVTVDAKAVSPARADPELT